MCLKKLQTEFRVKQEREKFIRKRLAAKTIQNWIRYQKKR